MCVTVGTESVLFVGADSVTITLNVHSLGLFGVCSLTYRMCSLTPSVTITKRAFTWLLYLWTHLTRNA